MIVIDQKVNLSDVIKLIIAAARAYAGDFTGLAAEAYKWRKVIVSILFAIFMFIVILVAMITSIPSFIMQSIMPTQNNDTYIQLAETGMSQLSLAQNESNSLWSSIISIFTGQKNEGTTTEAEQVVADVSPDIDYEVVLILYNVKYGGYGKGELLDLDIVKEIAKMFMEESDGQITQHSFESVLDKIDVDEIQHTVAINMFQQLAYTQIIDPSYIDFGTNTTSNEPVELKDVAFKNGSTNVVYFNQGDKRWANVKYGKYDGIKVAGCGPTSLAIAVASFTGKNITPVEVANWSVVNGYRVEGAGSSHALIPEGAKHYGLTVEGATYREQQKVVDALADGKLVIAIMGKGHFTTSGHFIVLRGVTEDGKILVADPASVKKSNQEWDAGIIFGEARKSAGAGGAFWIISP